MHVHPFMGSFYLSDRFVRFLVVYVARSVELFCERRDERKIYAARVSHNADFDGRKRLMRWQSRVARVELFSFPCIINRFPIMHANIYRSTHIEVLLCGWHIRLMMGTSPHLSGSCSLTSILLSSSYCRKKRLCRSNRCD